MRRYTQYYHSFRRVYNNNGADRLPAAAAITTTVVTATAVTRCACRVLLNIGTVQRVYLHSYHIRIITDTGARNARRRRAPLLPLLRDVASAARGWTNTIVVYYYSRFFCTAVRGRRRAAVRACGTCVRAFGVSASGTYIYAVCVCVLVRARVYDNVISSPLHTRPAPRTFFEQCSRATATSLFDYSIFHRRITVGGSS